MKRSAGVCLVLGMMLVGITAPMVLAQAPSSDFYAGKSAAEAERLRAQLDGVFGVDSFGSINSVRDTNNSNEFYDDLLTGLRTFRTITGSGGESSSALPFYVGFPAYSDVDVVADPDGAIKGVIGVDVYGQLRTYPLPDVSESETPVGDGPHLGYYADIVGYNGRTALPGGSPESAIATGGYKDVDVYVPFWPFDIVRDLELAVDWRQATNSYQGLFILDGQGGVHYINDGEVLAMMSRSNRSSTAGTVSGQTVGTELFYDLFDFRPIYSRDFQGSNPPGPAPYWPFDIARDLEVSVRWTTISTSDLPANAAKATTAQNIGIDVNKLTTNVVYPTDRAYPSNETYGGNVAITRGYYILDGQGGVHSLIEDENGNPVPAAWESQTTGGYASDLKVPVPYYGGDLAVDLEVLPNEQGYAILLRTGPVFFVPARGKTIADIVDVSVFRNNDPQAAAPKFGADVARGLKLVIGANGKVKGYYVIDVYGVVHRAGEAPYIAQTGTSALLPTYDLEIGKDVEISPMALRTKE